MNVSGILKNPEI